MIRSNVLSGCITRFSLLTSFSAPVLHLSAHTPQPRHMASSTFGPFFRFPFGTSRGSILTALIAHALTHFPQPSHVSSFILGMKPDDTTTFVYPYLLIPCNGTQQSAQ